MKKDEAFENSILGNRRSILCSKLCCQDERPEKRCELESNHTHFLLFDDGQAES